MRKFVYAFALTLGILFSLASHAEAQDRSITDKWPECKLGAAPVAKGTPPSDAQVFPANGGPVVMSEAGPNGGVRLLRCRLRSGEPSYRGADGVLRDVASNQPYFPVGWDAAPPLKPIAEAIQGLRGERGLKGDTGLRGDKGDPGKNGKPGRDGFCSGKTCRWLVGGTAAALTAGGVYYATHQSQSGGGVAIAIVVNK